MTTININCLVFLVLRVNRLLINWPIDLHSRLTPEKLEVNRLHLNGGRYKHRKGPKRTEKDRKGPKRTEKEPKRTEKGPKRTEKDVITNYLPKRRKN